MSLPVLLVIAAIVAGAVAVVATAQIRPHPAPENGVWAAIGFLAASVILLIALRLAILFLTNG